MAFMILRRADRFTEASRLSPEESKLLFATLKPSASALRLTIRDGQATVTPGPFEPVEMIAGFAIVDVPTRQEALDWLARWPVTDHEIELEIRESGCHAGCAPVLAAGDPDADGKLFAILLRSSADLEAETPVPQHRLDTLAASNGAEMAAGVLLAGDGLRTSARGARVKLSTQARTIIDGPFTEIKEMIAGFWLIRVASMDDALAWARRNPYPTGPDVDVEIRELYLTSQDIAPFTPDLEADEQRIRALQLEAGMRAHFTA
ncbi:MAG: YciI family protein [Pseudomonadota bacterium]